MNAPVDCSHAEWRRIRETPLETGLRDVVWSCQDCADFVEPPLPDDAPATVEDGTAPVKQANSATPWTWR
jgi:hypothetical protein